MESTEGNRPQPTETMGDGVRLDNNQKSVMSRESKRAGRRDQVVRNCCGEKEAEH